MSIFDILPWWTWAIATFGFAGLIALAIFAPALFGLLLSQLGKAFAAAIRTPLGAGLIAGAAAFVLAWVWSGVRAEQQCNARIEQMKRDARALADKRDAEIEQKVEAKYRPVIETLEQRAGELAQQVDAYEQKVTVSVTRDKCVLGVEPLRLRQRR